eukprot:gene5662-7048_t
MKTEQLRTLQTLRVLREQRAASQLAAQQQRCAQTRGALTDAKEQLRLHREAVAHEAGEIYASLTEGLSVASWQAAQDRLRGLADDEQVLEGDVSHVSSTLQTQERERELFRQERLSRQRQSDAWQSLLDGTRHMIVALADPLAPWLEHYDPALLTLHNQLHRRRHAWQGRCAGQDLSVAWAADPQPLKTPRDVLLLLGQSPVRLRLSAAALEQVLVPLALQFDAQVLPALPRSLLLELAVLDLIERLEPLLGHPVQLLETSDDLRPYAVHLALTLTFGNNPPMAAQLDLSESAAVLVGQLLDQHGQIDADPLPALRHTLSVVAGRQWLSLGELRSLQPGDVLMLEPGSGWLLDLEGRLQARCQRDGSSLQVQEPLNTPLLDMENTMTDVDAAAALDDLPLKLVCQVGSLELTLAQLRELGAGSLLQLNTPTVDGVDLMVNGRR